MEEKLKIVTDILGSYRRVGNEHLYHCPYCGHHKKKSVILMDEVDGCGAGDRGGIAALIAMIKASKVPVICICNDRQSRKIVSLVNHCYDLKFHRPTPEMI